MKKIGKILLLLIGSLLVSGCNNLENATLYTTTYPIEYLAKTLYETHSTIQSIYPDGTDVTTYELTDSQKDTYSQAEIFIYNGTTICYYDAKTTTRGLSNSDSIPFFLRKSQWKFLNQLPEAKAYYIARVFIGDNGNIQYVRIITI